MALMSGRETLPRVHRFKEVIELGTLLPFLPKECREKKGRKSMIISIDWCEGVGAITGPPAA